MRFKIVVKNKYTGIETVCSGEFAPEEVAVLRDFQAYSSELSSAEMFRNGWKSSPLGWSEQRGFYSEDKTPKSQIRELVHLLRPFVLQGENTNYFKVVNILSKRMDSVGIRALLKRWKDGFSQDPSQASVAISANGLLLNSDKAFFLWLNAFEYHRDKEKQTELEAALGSLPFELAKNVFINAAVVKVDAISRLAKFIWDIEHAAPGDPVGMIGGRAYW